MWPGGVSPIFRLRQRTLVFAQVNFDYLEEEHEGEVEEEKEEVG